ncbi:MAG: L-rhamnose isomerase [Planctomycetes bacterium]|nr:L-rhamnose isomerase [Planctomycetota bacterium]
MEQGAGAVPQLGGRCIGRDGLTGNFPGKARTAAKLRADVDKVFPLIPGTHRLTLRRVAHF